jgi:hypothetical protein
MMSRQHYQAIAEITKNILQGSGLMIPMINTLSDYFKRDNPAFDKTRFKTACLNGDLKPAKVKVGVSIDDVQDPPVKAKLQPDISTIMTSRNRVESILVAGEVATKKMNEKSKEIAKKNRKKD